MKKAITMKSLYTELKHNKPIVEATTISTIACKEELHKALQPIEIGAENQAYLKSVLASIERELDKLDYKRNWAVREIPLDIPEIDLDYQRVPRDSEVAKIINNFDMNKVDIKMASIRRDENGKLHLYVVDGYHTLIVLRLLQEKHPEIQFRIALKCFAGLTKKQEANIFSTQNEYHTNIRGYERYKAELVGENPCALAIQRQLKMFGLTTKNDLTSQVNRVRNVNAIEELYRIYKKNGEEAINYTFQLIHDAGWEDSTWAYKQRTLGGISCTFEEGQNPYARARLLCAMSSVSCEQFLDDALKLGGGDHHSDKVRNYCKSLMG